MGLDHSYLHYIMYIHLLLLHHIILYIHYIALYMVENKYGMLVGIVQINLFA